MPGGTWAQSSLDDTEQALAAFVEAQQEPAIALLERAVNINSGTMNPAGVRRVGDLFAKEFAPLGFRTRWIDGKPFQRAGHLVAERPGTGPHVLLIGHLDTVFEPESPFQKFERVDADTARGPGTSDMKGGIVVALAALRALASVNALDDLGITLVLNGDEEDVGEPVELSRTVLVEAAIAADIAIGLENADDDPQTAVTARRSSSSWTLKVKAGSGHSSQIFREEVGAGAIFEMARILDQFHTQLSGEEYLTFNPGLVLGGARVELDHGNFSGHAAGKSNIIAPLAIVSGDLRALTVEQREGAKAKMQEIVAHHPPHAGAEISFRDGYPPMAPTDGNRKLLGMVDRASRDLGLGPVTSVDPRRAGAADISFIADKVDMAIDGLGLLGGGNHTPEEFADLRTLRIQAQRLALLLFRLGRP
ncbi:MAG: M20/M25/M40 family metallo-hydrolase [Gammaproteobacteria bacterium]|nr:M20/M25/M40 family metallo-hydrolase [Gammaproteobacteria bacterium]